MLKISTGFGYRHRLIFLPGILLTLVILISFILLLPTQPEGFTNGPFAWEQVPVTDNHHINDYRFSLDSVLESPQFSAPNPQTGEPITLLVTGDVNLGRSVNLKMLQASASAYPFTETDEFLQAADIALINLETPLINQCPRTNTGMVFCSEADHAASLFQAGIDLASLANNHALNQGKKGLEQTKQALLKHGIHPLGDSQSAVYKLKNKTLVFLAFDLVGHKFSQEALKQSIKAAKTGSDFVVTFFHWGAEYTSNPGKLQKETARDAVDSGADLVLGNHPHWVQAMEVYRDKLIVYSHGNFVFDQLWSRETREGIVGLYTFSDQRVAGAEFIPIWINNKFEPEPANEPTSEKIENRIKTASRQLSQPELKITNPH